MLHVMLKAFLEVLKAPPAPEKSAQFEVGIYNAFQASGRDDRWRIWVMMRTVGLCWILYDAPPGQLIRRARGGDLIALENLLRLDRRLFYERGIQRRFRNELWDSKSAFVRTALRAVKGKPAAMSLGKLKTRLAAMVQVIADGSSLFEEPILRKMFDELVKFKSKGHELRDRDLPQGSEAFRKAIWRERERINEKMKEAIGQK
jgi:hypothetical protein